jgi:ATP-binding cassette subfamily B protein
VGLLSQDFVKFGFQVWENIFVGNPNVAVDMDKITLAAKKAKADDFINTFPNKYDTYLAPDIAGGVDPSGGQWQRIAISRVFYRNPSLIVLDEPTSAIDSLAEEEIFTNIKDFAKEKTVLMVSHRFATVKKADYIFVLSDGQVVEQGTHKELSEKDGLYATMYSAQTA